MTRFYLKQKEDPHGPQISMFVGNLPTGLSQRQYEKILLDIVGKSEYNNCIYRKFRLCHAVSQFQQS